MPRWLSETKSRIGGLLFRGTSPAETTLLATSLHNIALNWRRLLVGHEGFRTQHPGLFREPVRWGEQDPLGHVNNANYLRFFEHSRIEYLRQHKLVQFMAPQENGNLGLILKDITVNYKFPVQFPDRTSSYHRITEILEDGTIKMEGVTISEKHQRVAARSSEVLVVYDYGLAKRVAAPGFMFEVLKRAGEVEGKEARAVGKARGELQLAVKGIEGV